MDNNKYRTWIEIDKAGIRHNYRLFRKLIGSGTLLLGVVKSNAYGHELVGFSKSLSDLGIDWLGVDSIVEANTLRRQGIKIPILVLGYTLPSNFRLAHSSSIALTISSFENLKALAKLGRNVSVHLKIDTGMHRQGFSLSQLPEALSALQKHPKLHLQGIYTHFAAAKNPDTGNFTERQIATFNQAAGLAKSMNPQVLVHASATAGTLNYPIARYDMVRVGAGLYGLWPSSETEQALSGKIGLKPVLSWKSVISEIKTVEKGEKIGYDYTEVLQKDTEVAMLPIGYWHGYWRAFSGKAFALVKGKRAKVLGRVSMDMTAIDITGIPKVSAGDEAVLIGKSGKEQVTADELAVLAGTTNYEIVTRLNPLIKKFFI